MNNNPFDISQEIVFDNVSPVSVLDFNPEKEIIFDEIPIQETAEVKPGEEIIFDEPKVLANPDVPFDNLRTKLNDDDYRQFVGWVDTLPENLRSNIDYDLEGFWLASGKPSKKTMKDGTHLTDYFKLPNHPTFSNESKFSNADHEGGRWVTDKDGKHKFFASEWNLQNARGDFNALREYVSKSDPDTEVVNPYYDEDYDWLDRQRDTAIVAGQGNDIGIGEGFAVNMIPFLGKFTHTNHAVNLNQLENLRTGETQREILKDLNRTNDFTAHYDSLTKAAEDADIPEEQIAEARKNARSVSHFAELLQGEATNRLKEFVQNKRDAQQRLMANEANVWGKIVNGTITNIGYTGEFMIASSLAPITYGGSYAALVGAGAAQRYAEGSNKEYSLDANNNLIVKHTDEDGLLGAGKAVAGAAVEVAVEQFLEKGLKYVPGVGKILSKMDDAIESGIASGVGAVAGKIGGAAASKAGKEFVQETAKAFGKATSKSGVNQIHWEMLEEHVQALFDEGLGLSSREVNRNLEKDLSEWWKQASSGKYNIDLFLGLVGTMGLQGAYATGKAYEFESDVQRNADPFLRRYLDNDVVDSLSSEEKAFLAWGASNRALNQKNVDKFLKSVKASANFQDAVFSLRDVDKPFFDSARDSRYAEQYGGNVVSDAIKEGRVHSLYQFNRQWNGNESTDENTGITIRNVGQVKKKDGTTTNRMDVINPDGNKIIVHGENDLDTLNKAIDVAHRMSIHNQLLDATRQQKIAFITDRINATNNRDKFVLYNTMQELIESNPDMNFDTEDFNMENPAVRMRDGRVAFVVDNFRNAFGVDTKIAHEAAIHNGLDKVFATREAKIDFLKKIKSPMIDKLRKFNDERRKNEGKEAFDWNSDRMLEEAFTHVYENFTSTPSLTAQVKHWMNDRLRTFGLRSTYSEADLFVMVNALYREMKQGDVASNIDIAGKANFTPGHTKRMAELYEAFYPDMWKASLEKSDGDVAQAVEHVRFALKKVRDRGETGTNLNEAVAEINTPQPTPIKTPDGIETPIQRVNVADVHLAEDIPNFKQGANPKTGVVEPIDATEFVEDPIAPILVLRRKDGRLDVVTGRHRLDLARRTGKNKIWAQIVDEADEGRGSVAWARAMDAQSNIRDGNGTLDDYISYMRESGMSREEAVKNNLTSSKQGRAAIALLYDAIPDVIHNIDAGNIRSDVAAGIAQIGKTEGEQRALLKYVLNKPNTKPDALPNILSIIKTEVAHKNGEMKQTEIWDILGSSGDNWIEETEQKEKAAEKIKKQLITEKNILEKTKSLSRDKLADTLKQHGIKVSADVDAVRKRIQFLGTELHRWKNWPAHEDLRKQVIDSLNNEAKKTEVEKPKENKKPEAKPEKSVEKPKMSDEKPKSESGIWKDLGLDTEYGENGIDNGTLTLGSGDNAVTLKIYHPKSGNFSEEGHLLYGVQLSTDGRMDYGEYTIGNLRKIVEGVKKDFKAGKFASKKTEAGNPKTEKGDLKLESSTADEIKAEEEKQRQRDKIKAGLAKPLKGSGEVNVQPEFDVGQQGQGDLFSPIVTADEQRKAESEKPKTSSIEYSKEVLDALDGLDGIKWSSRELTDNNVMWMSRSLELDKKYGDWWRTFVKDSGGHSTQISGTVKTYRNIGQWLKTTGFKGAILDASSGKGIGTKALREMGFNVTDVEPYPEDGYKPNYTSYADLVKSGKKFDLIISNAVLNVIPDDWRNDLVQNMGHLLADGGRMIVNVRHANEIKNSKNKIILDDDSEVLITTPDGKAVRAYQKGFTQDELVKYLQDTLGDGFSVDKGNVSNTGAHSGTIALVSKDDYAIRPISKDDQSHFDRVIDSYVSGNIKNNNPNIVLSYTPAILRKILKADKLPVSLPITITKSIIDKATGKVPSKITGDRHHIKIDDLRFLPDNLNHPIAVLDTKPGIGHRAGTKIVLTEIKDYKTGDNAIVVLMIDADQGRITLNPIASVHGRDKSHIVNWIKDGLLRYYDTNKLPKWLGANRGAIPRSAIPLGSSNILTEKDFSFKDDNSVAQSGEGVNGVRWSSRELTDEEEKWLYGVTLNIVKALNKSGFNKFEDLVRAVYLKKPEAYVGMKPYVRGIWNTIADRLDLEDVSRDAATAVFAEIENPAPTTPVETSKEPKTNNDASDEETLEIAEIVGKDKAIHNAAMEIASWLKQGKAFTRGELERIVGRHLGGSVAEGSFSMKDVTDILELGVNMHLQRIPSVKKAIESNSPENVISAITDIKNTVLSKIPTQTTRDAEMVKLQQFSTPPSEALVAAWIANIRSGETMLEPSAGIGGLATFAKIAGANVVMNEYSPRRAQILRQLGLGDKIFNYDAGQMWSYYYSEMQRDNSLKRPTVVVMNPPFSSSVVSGRHDTIKVGGKHIEEALATLEPNGRLVAIVGSGMDMVNGSQAAKAWWNRIKKDYAVRANIQVNGEEYRKYGTSFDNNILVIDKVAPDGFKTITGRVEKLEDLPTMLMPVLNMRAESEKPILQPIEQSTVRTKPFNNGEMLTGSKDDGKKNTRSPRSSGGSSGKKSTKTSASSPHYVKPSTVQKIKLTQNTAGSSFETQMPVEQVKNADPSLVALTSAVAMWSSRSLSTDEMNEKALSLSAFVTALKSRGDGNFKAFAQAFSDGAPDKFEEFRDYVGAFWNSIANYDKDLHPVTDDDVVSIMREIVPATTRKDVAVGDGTFSTYSSSVTNENGRKHPTELVEPTALRSIPAPEITYELDLDIEVVKKGQPSDAQIEVMALACQSMEHKLPNGMRRGFFIGDGTGVGKGTEIAGIISNYFNKGHKKTVWFSKNDSLFDDAVRDLGTYGLENMAFKFDPKSKTQAQYDEGIAYVTYPGMVTNADVANGKLVQPKQGKNDVSRAMKLIEWLGKDYDGLIVLDESHQINNSEGGDGGWGGKKDGSARAKILLAFLNELPNARVLYVSATGATEVSNLAYLERLGMWGSGTAFADKISFIEMMKRQGLSVLELVARDMKAMGVYMARTLSYAGIKNSTIVHEITPEQKKHYNEIVSHWQDTLQTFQDSIMNTGGANNGRAVGKMMSAFWSSQQRFFNQYLTSLQMGSVLEEADRRLANGESVVFQLVNTQDATFKKALSKAKESGDEVDVESMDLSPKEILINLVSNSFPTQLYHEVEKEGSDKTVWEPVFTSVIDEETGEVVQIPVEDPKALEEKKKLITRLSRMQMGESPLDLIIRHFGAENVAEVTGRGSRRVYKTDENGEVVAAIESRSKAKRDMEVDEFNNGKVNEFGKRVLNRRVLVFSDAGGTGKSFHADRRFHNQQKRAHFLVQAGWKADSALQGFGRTHRSNEVYPPEYILCTTDIEGQKRFISSIARRLGQLGALTAGDRSASGSGVFSEENNLENKYANEAVQQLFKMYFNEGNFLGFCRDLGYTRLRRDRETGTVEEKSTIVDKDGLLDDEKIPLATNFLNRLLSCDIDRQSRYFEQFMTKMREAIDRDKEAGKYDTGVQQLFAEKIEVKTTKKLWSNADNKSQTADILEVEISQKAKKIDFDTVYNKMLAQRPANTPIEFQEELMFFAVDNKTGVINGYIPAPAEWKGTKLVEMLKKYNIHGTTSVVEKRGVTTEGEFAKYRKLSIAEARKEWGEQLAKAPDLDSHSAYFVRGTMIPIWDRIGSENVKIFRVTDSVNGNTFIGLRLPPQKVETVLSAFGLAQAETKQTPTAILRKIITDGKTVKLENDWELKRRKVLGDWRVELVGPYEDYEISALVRGDYVFIEEISNLERMFIPRSSDAIEKFIERFPVKAEKKVSLSDVSSGEIPLADLPPDVRYQKLNDAINEYSDKLKTQDVSTQSKQKFTQTLSTLSTEDLRSYANEFGLLSENDKGDVVSAKIYEAFVEVLESRGIRPKFNYETNRTMFSSREFDDDVRALTISSTNDWLAARGLEPMPKMRRTTYADMDKAGQKMASNDAEMEKFLRVSAQTAQNWTATEVIGSHLAIRKLQEAYDRQTDKINEAIENGQSKDVIDFLTNERDLTMEQLMLAHTGMRKAAREWGLAGLARRFLYNPQGGFAGLLADTQAYVGRKLSAEEEKAMRQLWDGYVEANGKLDSEVIRKTTELMKTALGRLMREDRNHIQTPRSNDKIERDYVDAINHIAVHAHRSGGVLIGLPDGRKWMDAIRRYHMKVALETTGKPLNENEMLQAIHNDIDGIVKADDHDILQMITSHGNTLQLDNSALEKALREQRTIMNESMKVRDMYEKGIAPQLTGIISDKDSLEVREAKMRTRELYRLFVEQNPGILLTDDAKRIKSVQDTLMTRMKNEIESLESQIAAGEKLAREKNTMTYTPEMKALRERLEEVRARYREAFPPTPPTREEQIAKIKRLLENRLAKLNQKKTDLENATTDEERRAILATAKKEQLSDPSLDALREEIENTRNDILDLEEMMFPEGTPERFQKALDNRINRLKSNIERISERIATNNVMPQKREKTQIQKRVEADPKVIELTKIRNQAQRRLRQQREVFKRNSMPYGIGKALNWFEALSSIPRVARASLDFSATFIQGARLFTSHPQMGFDALFKSVKAFWSEKNADAITQALMSDPDYDEFVRMGGHIYHTSDIDMRGMPEEFRDMERKIVKIGNKEFGVEDIPGVKRSERSFGMFINCMNLSLYKAMKGTPVFGPEGASEWQKRDIANMLNVASGRGFESKGGGFGDELMNTAFWAARLAVAGFKQATLAPIIFAPALNGLSHERTTADRAASMKLIAIEQARALLGATAFSLVAMLLAGNDDDDWIDEVLDPRSSNFLNVKIGNTNVNFFGPAKQWWTFMARMFTGKTRGMDGVVRKNDRSQVAGRFIRGKLSPVVGLGMDLFSQKTFIGEELITGEAVNDKQKNVYKHIAESTVVPLAIKDAFDNLTQNKLSDALLLTPFILTGAGKSTMAPKTNERQINPYQQLSSDYKKAVKEGRREDASEMMKENPILRNQAYFDARVRDVNRLKRQINDLEKSGQKPSESLMKRYETAQQSLADAIKKAKAQ